jgi:hypothetical protein
VTSLPVYSVVIHRERGFEGSLTIAPPAGYVWVVRDVDVYANAQLDQATDFFVEEASTGATFVWFNWSASEQNLKQWRGRQVIPSLALGGGITIRQVTTLPDISLPVDVSISGYQLTEA